MTFVNKGFVLPLVLIVIALLAALSMGLSHMARLRMADLQLKSDGWADEKRASDVLHQVVFAMLTGSYQEGGFVHQGKLVPIDARGVVFNNVLIKIQDEAGLMSLVSYDRTKFQQLLNKLTDNDTAFRISAELADWLDDNDQQQFGGMEVAQYHSRGLLQSPRNGPLRSLGELLELPSMTPGLFNGKESEKGIKDLIVVGGAAHFNLAAAPREVVSPILALSNGVEANILSARKRGNWTQIEGLIDKDDWVFNGLPPFTASNRYRVEIDGERGTHIRAKIKLTPYDRDRLFSLIDWRAPYTRTE